MMMVVMCCFFDVRTIEIVMKCDEMIPNDELHPTVAPTFRRCSFSKCPSVAFTSPVMPLQKSGACSSGSECSKSREKMFNKPLAYKLT